MVREHILLKYNLGLARDCERELAKHTMKLIFESDNLRHLQLWALLRVPSGFPRCRFREYCFTNKRNPLRDPTSIMQCGAKCVMDILFGYDHQYKLWKTKQSYGKSYSGWTTYPSSPQLTEYWCWLCLVLLIERGNCHEQEMSAVKWNNKAKCPNICNIPCFQAVKMPYSQSSAVAGKLHTISRMDDMIWHNSDQWNNRQMHKDKNSTAAVEIRLNFSLHTMEGWGTSVRGRVVEILPWCLGLCTASIPTETRWELSAATTLTPRLTWFVVSCPRVPKRVANPPHRCRSRPRLSRTMVVTYHFWSRSDDIGDQKEAHRSKSSMVAKVLWGHTFFKRLLIEEHQCRFHTKENRVSKRSRFDTRDMDRRVTPVILRQSNSSSLEWHVWAKSTFLFENLGSITRSKQESCTEIDWYQSSVLWTLT